MTDTNHGSVRIADDVVAIIAGLAASNTKGIAGMSESVATGLTKRVSGRTLTKGVTVEVGQVETAIDLRVVVEYGVNIPEVCRQVQIEVKQAVEAMTGLQVKEVNVRVEGVEMKGHDKKQPETRVR